MLRILHRAPHTHLIQRTGVKRAHAASGAGPRAGRKVLTLVGGMAARGERREARRSPEWCANREGFSLHAGAHCAANDRQGSKQLCRYFTRPAIANERLSNSREGNVVLRLKTPCCHGATHLELTLMQFMQRLHRIRFHGVLAPNATLRSDVVPVPPPQSTRGKETLSAANAAANQSSSR